MKLLAENVKRLCYEQGKRLKDLAASMKIDLASLNRSMYGNARLDTIEKMANALGVSVESLFKQINEDKDKIEGYIKIKEKYFHFHSKEELKKILAQLYL